MRRMSLMLAAPALLGAALQLAQADTPTAAPGDKVLGKADAPITIIEYASMTCPHCAAFDIQTLPQIRSNWIDTGRAKLVFRDFPLDGLALRAAMLTHCGPPERYFTHVDFLFKDQTNWAHMSDTNQAMQRAASLGGLDKAQSDRCLADVKLSDAVAASRLTAEKQYGVTSTPTFFINGTKVTGDQPYAEFDKVLTAASPR